jgi:hypothetical protein
MSSILLIAEAEDPIQQGINRALMLARYLRARLDILFCNTERAYMPLAAQAPETRTQARAYLESLRTSVAAPDVEITTEAAFEGRLHEQVGHKARQCASTLIVKSTERLGSARAVRIHWPLLHHAPAPVLLTQGRAWHPRPRFAAAVEAGSAADPALPPWSRTTLTRLCEACGAELRLVRWPVGPVTPESDGDFDLLALTVSADPGPPAMVRQLADGQRFLGGCDLLFLRA